MVAFKGDDDENGVDDDEPNGVDEVEDVVIVASSPVDDCSAGEYDNPAPLAPLAPVAAVVAVAVAVPAAAAEGGEAGCIDDGRGSSGSDTVDDVAERAGELS